MGSVVSMAPAPCWVFATLGLGTAVRRVVESSGLTAFKEHLGPMARQSTAPGMRRLQVVRIYSLE